MGFFGGGGFRLEGGCGVFVARTGFIFAEIVDHVFFVFLQVHVAGLYHAFYLLEVPPNVQFLVFAAHMKI